MNTTEGSEESNDETSEELDNQTDASKDDDSNLVNEENINDILEIAAAYESAWRIFK